MKGAISALYQEQAGVAVIEAYPYFGMPRQRCQYNVQPTTMLCLHRLKQVPAEHMHILALGNLQSQEHVSLYGNARTRFKSHVSGVVLS